VDGQEYLDLVARISAEQGSPHGWRVGRETTTVVFGYDQETKRRLAVQFYTSGPRAGEFATAFEPDRDQYLKMLAAANTKTTP
jgi:hypothetical protein